MADKEIKNNARKLNDDVLENVNGGLLKTIILNVADEMPGRNLELNDDALAAVTGGCVSVEPGSSESVPSLCKCPKCGRTYKDGSSCIYCLALDPPSMGVTEGGVM